MNLLEGDTPKAKFDSLKIILESKKFKVGDWTDEIRLNAIDRSIFSVDPKVYLHGYYDGFIKGKETI